ncbi:hypothetical protein PSPO01_00624 [Paraphaeosphaeria sporulosa]
MSIFYAFVPELLACNPKFRHLDHAVHHYLHPSIAVLIFHPCSTVMGCTLLLFGALRRFCQ